MASNATSMNALSSNAETGKVSIREVAQKAGVSLGTVSNVLNRPDYVSDKNLQKVRAAMDALGFVPSRAAGQLRGRRSGLIGVVVPDVGNPYWASVLLGIEKVCDAHRMGMIVNSTRQNQDKERDVLQMLTGQGVDGLIIAPINVHCDELKTFSSRLGTVSIGRTPNTRYVGSNGLEGMAKATSELLRLGHRHIALINGKEFVSWCAARKKGVEKAMQEFGLDPSIYLHEYVVDDMTAQEGRAVVARLFDGERSVDGETPTAVICANDVLALGVMLACQERGIRIPQDLSLIGYDDVDFARVLSPSLTTIRQASYEIGRNSALMLVEGKEVSDRTQTELDEVELIVRQSIGPAPIRPVMSC